MELFGGKVTLLYPAHQATIVLRQNRKELLDFDTGNVHGSIGENIISDAYNLAKSAESTLDLHKERCIAIHKILDLNPTPAASPEEISLQKKIKEW